LHYGALDAYCLLEVLGVLIKKAEGKPELELGLFALRYDLAKVREEQKALKELEEGKEEKQHKNRKNEKQETTKKKTDHITS